jgi:hypothetical protein
VYAPIRSMPWVITSPVFSHLTKSSLIYFRVAKSHRRLRSGLLNYQSSINHDDFDYKFGGVCGYLIQKYKGLLFLFPEHNVVTVVRTITRSFYRPLDSVTRRVSPQRMASKTPHLFGLTCSTSVTISWIHHVLIACLSCVLSYWPLSPSDLPSSRSSTCSSPAAAAGSRKRRQTKNRSALG